MACLNLSAIFRLLYSLLPHLLFHWAAGGTSDWVTNSDEDSQPICISGTWQRVRGGSTRGDTSRQLRVRHTHPSLLHSFFSIPDLWLWFIFILSHTSLSLSNLSLALVRARHVHNTFSHCVPWLFSQLLCRCTTCQTTSFCGLSQVPHLYTAITKQAGFFMCLISQKC